MGGGFGVGLGRGGRGWRRARLGRGQQAKVVEDGADDVRVGEAGDDLEAAVALGTASDVFVEDARGRAGPGRWAAEEGSGRAVRARADRSRAPGRRASSAALPPPRRPATRRRSSTPASGLRGRTSRARSSASLAHGRGVRRVNAARRVGGSAQQRADAPASGARGRRRECHDGRHPRAILPTRQERCPPGI
jgi:hypothetical protein